MTPECRHVDEHLLDFAYQELDEAQRAELAAHIESCPRCSAELQAIAGTRSMLRELPDEEPSAAVTARLLHEAAAPRGLAARLRALLALFAVHPAWSLGTATAVVLIGVFLWRDPDQTRPGEREEAAREAIQPAHEPVAMGSPPPMTPPASAAAPDPAPAAPPPIAMVPRPSPERPPAGPPPKSPTRAVRKTRALEDALDEGRASSTPFAEMSNKAAEVASRGEIAAGGAGAGATAPRAPAAAAPEAPTVGDSLDDVLLSGASSAERVHRLADAARKREDCTEALRLYRKVLKEYPTYTGKAEVERGIRACQATKAAP